MAKEATTPQTKHADRMILQFTKNTHKCTLEHARVEKQIAENSDFVISSSFS